MALSEGTRVYLLYDVGPPELYHERYILSSCSCSRGWHVVLTPDHDVFPEQISLENSDLLGYRIGVGQQLPAGLSEANTYRIRALPDPVMLRQMTSDARHAGLALMVPPGAPLGAGVVAGAAAPPQHPAPIVGVVGGELWVRVETTEGHDRGEEVALDGSEILHGDVGLKASGATYFAIRRIKETDRQIYKGSEASADARLLGLSFQGLNREERLWRDVSKEISQEDFKDWAVSGPRTAAWCTRFLNRRNGGPTDHHRWWINNFGLKADAWGVAEHDCLTKILDKMGRYDGLDISNLACAEIAFRRLQLIEYYYSDRGPGGGKGASKGDKSKKDVDDGIYKMESSIFSGSHKEFGDTMVAPALMEYVSKEIKTEAAVMKQVRKAREERASAAK